MREVNIRISPPFRSLKDGLPKPKSKLKGHPESHRSEALFGMIHFMEKRPGKMSRAVRRQNPWKRLVVWVILFPLRHLTIFPALVCVPESESVASGVVC